MGVEAATIIQRLEVEPDLTSRRALLLSMGVFSVKELPAEARNALLPKVQSIYRNDPDPGLHAAAEWLLRQWKQGDWLKQVIEEWTRDKVKREGWWEAVNGNSPRPTTRWYVNTQGQTFTVIPGPAEFLMGSPATEADRRHNEQQHPFRIGHSFAMATTPVTKAQYLRFNPRFTHNEFQRYPEPTCPIGGLVWHEAAQYCNWLSKLEGFSEDQCCYEIKGNDLRLKAGYLSLSGYRLPTEAEMEYATRAGTITSRYFGETEDLLEHYGWYRKNSSGRTWPVGSLMPNEWGLFDVLGNIYTWCQESYKDYPHGTEPREDKEDDLVIVVTRNRVLRGGACGDPIDDLRCASRGYTVPVIRQFFNGFRLVRTVSLDGVESVRKKTQEERK